VASLKIQLFFFQMKCWVDSSELWMRKGTTRWTTTAPRTSLRWRRTSSRTRGFWHYNCRKLQRIFLMEVRFLWYYCVCLYFCLSDCPSQRWRKRSSCIQGFLLYNCRKLQKIFYHNYVFCLFCLCVFLSVYLHISHSSILAL